MNWPPFFLLDLNPLDLLPANWIKNIDEVATGPYRQTLITDPSPAANGGGSWSFSVVTGDLIREQIKWLWQFYHGAFKQFAGDSFGFELYPSKRLDATITLNILDGCGAGNIWHNDANPVSGLFFASTLAEDEGGELQFRSSDGRFCEIRPRAGNFVCFDGSCEHQVAPLKTAVRRLSFPMTYYRSAEDQPFANENNRYVI